MNLRMYSCGLHLVVLSIQETAFEMNTRSFISAFVVWSLTASMPGFGLDARDVRSVSTSPGSVKEQAPIEAEKAVSFPSPPYEDYRTRKHRSADEDKDFPSGNRLPLSLQLLRARNLLAAGHYEEAIKDYE